MDVHRTRFVDYTPPAVSAIAFSHPSNYSNDHSQHLRCAIGRANGDIEIWNPLDGWTHDITLKGGKGRSIEGLAWTTQKGTPPRLFSIGSSTQVTEWDLELLQPRTNLDCNAGPIWSIAVSPDQKNLAVGCEDGSLVMLDPTGGPGSLEYKYVLTRQKSRILSLAFSGPGMIVGGCSDSHLKVWDCSQARGPIIARMPVDRVRNEATLVWAVIVLKNGLIVSGDSTGAVKLWDKKFYSLLQNFKLHQADVLCLAASSHGNTIFSAGIDQKMHMYKLVDKQKRMWSHIAGRRYHSHDVRAMATFESKLMSFIVTGGIDTTIVVVPLADFEVAPHRVIPPSPQRPRCSLSRAGRLLMMWSDRQVKLWRLCEPYELDSEPQEQLVSKMTLLNEENLTSAALSQDGNYLVVASLVEIKLYMFRPSESSGALRPLKILQEDLSSQGARQVFFSDDSSLLFVVIPDSTMKVYTLRQSPVDEEDNMFDIEVKELFAIKNEDIDEPYKVPQPYMRSFNHAAISADGKHLAICNQHNIVKVYSLKDGHLEETLSKVPSSITAMTFHGSNKLVIAAANMALHEFVIKTASLSEWSIRNTPNIPERFLKIKDHCIGMRVDETHRLWLWGASWVSYFQLDKDLPPIQSAMKRKRGGGQDQEQSDGQTKENNGLVEDNDLEENNELKENTEMSYEEAAAMAERLRGRFWITFKYRSLLLFDILNSSELVVVERPLMDLINSPDIPPPFFVKKYGKA